MCECVCVTVFVYKKVSSYRYDLIGRSEVTHLWYDRQHFKKYYQEIRVLFLQFWKRPHLNYHRMEDFTLLDREITTIPMIGTCFQTPFVYSRNLNSKFLVLKKLILFFSLTGITLIHIDEGSKKKNSIHPQEWKTHSTSDRLHMQCHAAQWDNQRTGDHMPLSFLLTLPCQVHSLIHFQWHG